MANRATESKGESTYERPEGQQRRISGALIQGLMNERLGFRIAFGQQWVSWGQKHNCVLLVKPLNRGVAENPGPNRVYSRVSLALKKVDPVWQILKVNVIDSALPRNCCGEQYARGHGRQISY